MKQKQISCGCVPIKIYWIFFWLNLEGYTDQLGLGFILTIIFRINKLKQIGTGLRAWLLFVFEIENEIFFDLPYYVYLVDNTNYKKNIRKLDVAWIYYTHTVIVFFFSLVDVRWVMFRCQLHSFEHMFGTNWWLTEKGGTSFKDKPSKCIQRIKK